MTPVLTSRDPGPEDQFQSESIERQLADARREGARQERRASQPLMLFLMAVVSTESVAWLVAIVWRFFG